MRVLLSASRPVLEGPERIIDADGDTLRSPSSLLLYPGMHADGTGHGDHEIDKYCYIHWRLLSGHGPTRHGHDRNGVRLCGQAGARTP